MGFRFTMKDLLSVRVRHNGGTYGAMVLGRRWRRISKWFDHSGAGSPETTRTRHINGGAYFLGRLPFCTHSGRMMLAPLFARPFWNRSPP